MTAEQLKEKRLCSDHFDISNFNKYGVAKKVLSANSCPITTNLDTFLNENDVDSRNLPVYVSETERNSALRENTCIDNIISNSSLHDIQNYSSVIDNTFPDPELENSYDLEKINFENECNETLQLDIDDLRESSLINSTGDINDNVLSPRTESDHTVFNNHNLNSDNSSLQINSDSCLNDNLINDKNPNVAENLSNASSEIIFNDSDVNSQRNSVGHAKISRNHLQNLPSTSKPHVHRINKNRKKPISSTQLIELQRTRIKTLQRRVQRQSKVIKRKKKLNKEQLLDALKDHIKDSSVLTFFKMQLCHKNRQKWEEDERQFALRLHYVSPVGYKLLKKEAFKLPGISTIQNWVNEISLLPGINKEFFDILKLKASTMSDFSKTCVLMWDEMEIKKNLQYNRKFDLIEGFEDLGEYGRTPNLGNKVLVFMIRGLYENYKQPLFHVVAHKAVKGKILKKLIVNALENLENAGFIVRYMVCDQGSTNQSAVCDLGITDKKPYIERQGRKIFFGYDIPHLIKCIRNILLLYDIIDNDKVVTWEAIKELREFERFNSCKAAPKLTDIHINPNNFQKQRVKYATQVFSSTVSAALISGYTTGSLKNPHCISTANFAKNVNDMFDCCNARHPYDSNPLKRGLGTANSTVEDFLRKSLSFIEHWKVSSGNVPDTLPDLQLTIGSILKLWEDLRGDGVKFLLTSRLNQDPIENKFAIYRRKSGSNDHPDEMQFRSNFQHTSFITLLIPAGTNCEADTLPVLLANRNSEYHKVSEEERNELNKNIETWVRGDDIQLQVDDNCANNLNDIGADDNDNFDDIYSSSLEKCTKKYIAGYLIYECLNYFGCIKCRENLCRDNQNLESNDDLLLFWKAYKVPEKALGNLKVPTDDFFKVILTAYNVFENEFRSNYHKKGIGEYVKSKITEMIKKNHSHYWFSEEECEYHRQHIIESFVRLHIFYNIKWISRDARQPKKSTNKRPPDCNSALPRPNKKLLKHSQ